MASGSSRGGVRQAALISALAASVFLASGCMTMSESECRTANWEQVGQQDGIAHGIRPRIDQLRDQCRAYGVVPDEEKYMTGWRYGYAEYQRRMVGSECCR